MKKSAYRDAFFNREDERKENYEIIRDIHKRDNAEICYIKHDVSFENGGVHLVPISSMQVEKQFTDAVIGTVIHGIENNRATTIWIPRDVDYVTFDANDRVRHLEKAEIQSKWEFDGDIRISLSGMDGDYGSVLFPYIKFIDPQLAYYDELTNLSDNEQNLYRRSNWFYVSSIASIWDYLIHGSLYDPQPNHTNKSRIKCQQCAYTWWKYLQDRYIETGKNIYALIRDEVAYSILLDMDEDGGWRHGFWSDDMETHARFHLDGLELFLSQYELTNNKLWLHECRRGIEFILNNLTDHLDNDMIWFLHDTIEDKKHHYFKSTIFGKDPGNSLCINTHSHALRVLYRLQQNIPDNDTYRNLYGRGMKALRHVLEYQPADYIYRPFIPWVLSSKVVVTKNRVIRKLQSLTIRRIKKPIYWKIKSKYPRLVHPNGFIDRDLTLSYASDRYHITNMKELLKLYEPEKPEWLKKYIVDGVNFMISYINKKGMRDLIQRSPYYIEVIDIMVLYSALIDEMPSTFIESLRSAIYEVTGGYSVEGQRYDTNKTLSGYVG